jgi:hypothetical protein
MFKPPSFRSDGDTIRIVNGRSRAESVVLLIAGAVLAVLPFLPMDVLRYVRDAGDSGGAPAGLCLLGAFGCLSAAFWWSEVTIDPTTNQVRIVRRWGLWRTVYRTTLSAFGAVALVVDSDGEAEVHLRGEGADYGISWMHSRAILWGRSFQESWLIAGILAERLGLRLDVPTWPTAV